MAQVRMTKVRGFIAAVVAIVLLIVFAAIVTSSMDMNVPVLQDIADAIGF
jgi:hypothetical protein